MMYSRVDKQKVISIKIAKTLSIWYNYECYTTDG